MENDKKTSSTYFFIRVCYEKSALMQFFSKKELEKGLIALSEREGVRLYRWALTFTRSQPDLNCNIQFSF